MKYFVGVVISLYAAQLHAAPAAIVTDDKVAQCDDLPACEKACGQGDAAACAGAGTRYGRARDPAAQQSARVLFERGCELKNGPACDNLGLLWVMGALGKPDPVRAAEAFRRGCDRDTATACANLAVLLRKGDLGARDDKAAAPLFERACKSGMDLACAAFGSLLLDGIGLPHDTKRAVSLLGRACDHKIGQACVDLALLYANGRGVPVSVGKALGLLSYTCLQGGHPVACYEWAVLSPWIMDLGKDALIPRDEDAITDAGRRFAAACDQGDAIGCERAAVLAENGLPDSQDRVRAGARFAAACKKRQLKACTEGALLGQREGTLTTEQLSQELDSACRAGEGRACNRLGLDAQNVRHDLTAAAERFERGCKLGDMPSCTNQSTLLADSQDPADRKKAAELVRRACASGTSPLGCEGLARFLLNGVGVAIDAKKAAALLTLACDQQFGSSCNVLGTLYMDGRGVTKQPAKAVGLFAFACDHGEATGCSDLAEMREHGLGGPIDREDAARLRAHACELDPHGAGCGPPPPR